MKGQNVLLMIVIFLIPSLGMGQMIAEIGEDVTTDFGSYRPYPAVFSPQVPTFTVEADFGNVANFERFRHLFTKTDLDLLTQNHFTVKYSQYKQLHDIYNDCTWDGTPVFVTTDAVLHIYHVLFDQMLCDIEVRKFIDTLDLLTQALMDEAEVLYNQSGTADVREACRRSLAFLGVAKKLLRGENATVSESVTALVDSELVLISDHAGFEMSPIFGSSSALDYSQFHPRGHYTKSDDLKAYFKTMMWYGLTIFTMESQKFGDLARRHTLQALMFTQAIYTLEKQGQSLLALWSTIYEPTVFFVGKSDDPNIKHYKTIGEEVYGPDFLSLSPDLMADVTLLEQFMTEAQKLQEPKIPNWIYGSLVTFKGFRFMGQRFIPDSYVFAHLVLPEVSGRYFPKGLDIMAILGSDRAYTLLDSLYHETTYGNYPEKMAEFKTEFSGFSPAQWAQNLYWNWLYCLMPLLYQKGEGYPRFMQTLAWADKELMTALASWAELRHDTILYAKQSGTPCCVPPGPPRSYVEPNPHLYARLASLVRYTREGLESFDLLLEGYEDKLDLFENLLLFLRNMAIKELENVPITDQEYEDIFCFGKVMRNLVSVVKDPDKPWEMEADDMAVVADVHTDSNTDRCLEEGVGYPLEIFVIVNEGGIPRVTRGAIFSYYEFLQPIADRLTDEAWREMLTSDAPPELPVWAGHFMDVPSIKPELISFSPDNLFNKEFTPVKPGGGHPSPTRVYLHQNHPNPFNPETTIRYEIPKQDHVTLTVYNLLGRKVVTLFQGDQPAGFYTITWNGRDMLGRPVSSGVYLIALTTRQIIQTRKMFLMR